MRPHLGCELADPAIVLNDLRAIDTCRAAEWLARDPVYDADVVRLSANR
jgi:hypothetical protein